MNFIRDLRKSGDVKYLCVVCIVQKRNVQDLEKLYNYCLEWGADDLVFAPLRNGLAFSNEYFREHNVALSDNVLYEKTRAIIDDIVADATAKSLKIHVGLY